MSYFCNDCNIKPFSSHSALNTHRNAVHVTVRVENYPIDVHDHKCLDGCSLSFPTVKDLRQHLARNHKILTGQEIFEFDDKEEFRKWMENINRDPIRKYIKTCELQDNEYLLVTHYDCKPVKEIPPNDGGTDSDNSCAVQEIITSPSCTSQILVVDNLRTNLIVVTFFKNHYGHTKDMKHLENPINYMCRKSLNCVSKKLLKTPAHLPIISDTSRDHQEFVENISNGGERDNYTQFILGTKKRKKRIAKPTKTPHRKRISKSYTEECILEANAQDSDEMYSDHLYCKVKPEARWSSDHSPSNQLNADTNWTLSNPAVDDISAPSDVNSEKTKLKKSILSLIKKLSEDNLELYDINTLAQVENSLTECCCFLGSYELAADCDPLSDDNGDATSPRISTSPPKLVWFPNRKE